MLRGRHAYLLLVPPLLGRPIRSVVRRDPPFVDQPLAVDPGPPPIDCTAHMWSKDGIEYGAISLREVIVRS